jgi:hypothetical protein
MPMVSTSVVIEQSAYVTEMASLLKKKEGERAHQL